MGDALSAVVRLTPPTGSGTLTPTTTTTNSGGDVFANFTAPSTAGGTATVAVSDAFGDTGSVVITIIGGATPTALSLTVGGGRLPSSSAIPGSVLAIQPKVQLVDGAGNPVANPGVTVLAMDSVAVLVTGGAQAITPNFPLASAVTDASGVATFTGLGIDASASTTPVYLFFVTPGGLTAKAVPITLIPSAPSGPSPTRLKPPPNPSPQPPPPIH